MITHFAEDFEFLNENGQRACQNMNSNYADFIDKYITKIYKIDTTIHDFIMDSATNYYNCIAILDIMLSY